MIKHSILIIFLCIMPSLVLASAEARKPTLKIELHGLCQSLTLEQAVEALKQGKKEQRTSDMQPVTIRVEDEAHNRLFSCELKAYFPEGKDKKGGAYLVALLLKAMACVKNIESEEKNSALAKLEKEIEENQKTAERLAAQRAALLAQASPNAADSKAELSTDTK